MLPLFDIFKDRTARLLRNELSSAFMEDLKGGKLTFAPQIVDGFSLELEPVHTDYAAQRLEAYGRVLQIVNRVGGAETLAYALILWDEGLFFEVHEWLEGLWLAASGNRKKALQALIRGAGAFVHLQQGNTSGAQKMAVKAVDGLQEFGGELVPVVQVLPSLCEGLLSLTPPLLYGLYRHE